MSDNPSPSPSPSDGPGPNGGGTGPLPVGLLDLLKAGGSLPTLGLLLAQAPLTVEQRTVVEILQALQQDDEAARGSAEPKRARSADDKRSRGARWAQTSATAFQQPEEEEEDEEEEPPRESPNQRELDDLREVNDTLAAALGACRACWGGDTECPLCNGRGGSGAALPDEQLFDALVTPALRRMHGTRARQSRQGRDRHHEYRVTSTEAST